MAGRGNARERLRKKLGEKEADALLAKLDNLAKKSAKKIELTISDALTKLLDASIDATCRRGINPSRHLKTKP